MASSTSTRLSREEMLKKKAEDEARRAGTLPAEKDAQGRTINPHIPEFMKVAPWYIGSDQAGLDHQRLPESQKYSSDIRAGWYDRGKSATTTASSTLSSSAANASSVVRKSGYACTNCGAVTHVAKNCLEKPKKIGAAKLGMKLAADDTVQPKLNLSYDGKRDTYNGLDTDAQMRALQRKNNLLKAMESIAETKEVSKDEKGIQLPKASLRVRSDTAKYLRNLDPDSAFYDPKTRSMRANPTPHVAADQLTFAGDNFVRHSGDAVELERMEEFAALRSEQTSDASQAVQANPTALALAKKDFEQRKHKLAEDMKKRIEDAYGASAATVPPPASLTAASVAYVEYAPDGKVVKGMEAAVAASCYEEDVLEGNHTQVWGSYFDAHSFAWGYGCCWQMIRKSFCTGGAGREAAKAAIMRARPTLENREQQQANTNHSATTESLSASSQVASSSSSSSNTNMLALPSSSAMYGETEVRATDFDKEKLAEAVKRAKSKQQKEEQPSKKRRSRSGSSASSSSSSSSSSDWSSSSEGGESSHAKKKKHHKKKKSRKSHHRSHSRDDDKKSSKKRFTEKDDNDNREMTPEGMEAYRLTRIRNGDPMADFKE